MLESACTCLGLMSRSSSDLILPSVRSVGSSLSLRADTTFKAKWNNSRAASCGSARIRAPSALAEEMGDCSDRPELAEGIVVEPVEAAVGSVTVVRSPGGLLDRLLW